jgi:hypothetical protein
VHWRSDVRAMFFAYTLVIGAGLLFYLVIGLIGR